MVAIVQSTSIFDGSGPTSFPLSFSGTPVVGNSVIVSVFQSGPTGLITGVTDNQAGGTNVYTKVVQKEDSAGIYADAELWWCPALLVASGTFTVTVAVAGSPGGGIGIFIAEASGLSGVVDISSSVNDAGVSGTTGTVTNGSANTQASDLAIALYGQINLSGVASGLSTPPNTGYTSIGFFDAPTHPMGASVGYKVLSALETTSANWTWTTAQQRWSAVLATFKGPSVGAALAASPAATASLTASLSTFTAFVGLPLLPNLTPPNTGLSFSADAFSLQIANPLVNYANGGRTNFSTEASYAMSGTVDSPTIAGDVPGTTNHYVITPSTSGLTLNGLLTGSTTLMQAGFTRLITNGSATNSFNLGHAASANTYDGFLCPSGVAYSIPPYGSVLLIYSATLGASRLK